MGAHGAVDQQLQQIGPQHVPVVIVVLLALVTAHHQTANSLVRQQCFIDCKVGEVGLDRGAFLRVQRLAGFQSVECSGRIARVIGERIRRQTRREVISHGSTLRSGTGIALAVAQQARVTRDPVWGQFSEADADKMVI
jgi:hypothetical protein